MLNAPAGNVPQLFADSNVSVSKSILTLSGYVLYIWNPPAVILALTESCFRRPPD